MKYSGKRQSALNPGLIYLLSLLLIISFTICCNKDKKDWEEAQSANTIASYNDYLELYPEGANTDAARSKIKDIQDLEKELQDLEKELQDLDNANSLNLIPVFNAFIKNYPQSSHRDAVTNSLEKLYNKIYLCKDGQDRL